MNIEKQYKKIIKSYEKNAKRIGDKHFYQKLYENLDFLSSASTISIRQRGYKNQDKIIALLRLPYKWIPSAGFYALFHRMMNGLYFAERFGFTPVADRWIGCAYEEKEQIDGTNVVFEYYFNPLSDISLDDALESYSVVIPGNPSLDMMARKCQSKEWYRPNDVYVREMARLYKKYVSLNEKTSKKIKTDINGLIGSEGEQCLAVHFRGTDYKGNWNGHPVSIDFESYVHSIRECLETGKYSKILLATDDNNYKDLFYKEFKNVVCYDDVFRSDNDVSAAFSKSDRELHGYRLGYEVIRDVYTMANCGGFISGHSMVSQAAEEVRIAQDKEYKDRIILDKGININSKIWMESKDWKK